MAATTADLRQIAKALNCCLAVFERYDAILTPAQRDVQRLVQETRRFAEQELEGRRVPTVELVAI